MASVPARATTMEVTDAVYLLPLHRIAVGQRLRPVDPDWAASLARILKVDGQRTPIEVQNYRGNGDYDWSLVAGAHRLTAAQLAGLAFVKAIIVEGDAIELRLRETSENVWRKDLGPLDRAAFVAEMHELLRARAGVHTSTSGQALAANARWQKQLATDAIDATEIISVAYGFDAEIASYLRLTDRTIRNDLLLHRRLRPAIAEALRGHPIAENAAQLRALAKLDEREQTSVSAMLREGTAKRVAEAVAILRQRPRPSPQSKRLNAFYGAYQRMGLAEKKGALQQLAGMLPAGLHLVDDGTAKGRRARYRAELIEAVTEMCAVVRGFVEEGGGSEFDRLDALSFSEGKLRLAAMPLHVDAVPLAGDAA